MHKTALLLACSLAAVALLSGCESAQRKLGRGMSNSYDIVRGGEFLRTMEQTALLDGPEAAYGGGFIRGLSRSVARTGIGIFEIVTFPIPPYNPIFTDHYAPDPVYPDSNTPGLLEDSMFATDTNLGFSGGDVLPMVPGSRFRIFDAH